MRLVDDDRVVAPQHRVALDLREQDAVGHHLEQRLRPGGVGEPDREADVLAERRPDLLGDPLGDRARGDPAGLGVADEPGAAAARLEGELGQLGGLARAGGARDDDDLVVADQPDELLAAAGDRQLLGVAQRRQGLVRGGEAGGLAAGLLLALLGARGQRPGPAAATAPAVRPARAAPSGPGVRPVRPSRPGRPASPAAPAGGRRPRPGGRCVVGCHVVVEGRRPRGAGRSRRRPPPTCPASPPAGPDAGGPPAGADVPWSRAA